MSDASTDEPPELSKGRGRPFTGTSPATIAELYTTWNANPAAMAAQRKAPRRSRASCAVSSIRQSQSR